MNTANLSKGKFYQFISGTLLILSIQFGNASILYGQTGLDSLFRSDDLLYIELYSDFKEIIDTRWYEDSVKGGEAEYYEAKILYGEEDNQVEVPLRIKARGQFRRNPKHCKFPPLLLNFKKKEVKGTLFEGQDKVKMVTFCQDEPEVIKEYVVYKMFNLITDWSFNVRLVNVSYINTPKNKKLYEKIGFFIEEDEKVAKRHDSEIVKKHHFPFDLDPDNEAKVSMFQFMIGNPDWYYTTGQNTDIMHPTDTMLAPMAVPYDFDFSEFVDADYTKPTGVPDEYLAKKRLFKGMCLSDDRLSEIIDYFNMMKPQFMEVINNNEYLPKFSKKECVDYLEEFYTIINTQDMLQTEVLDTCYTRKDYLPFE
jgi:hypothetical protein